MTLKPFYSLFLAVALAPVLGIAQPSPGASASPQVAPAAKAQVPQTRIAPPISSVRSNAFAPRSADSSVRSPASVNASRLPPTMRGGGDPAARSASSFGAPPVPGAASAAPVSAAPAAGTNAPLATTLGDDEVSYNFVNIPLEQVLDIYAELINRTLLRASTGAAVVDPKAQITLKTQGTLSKGEAIMAIETVLGMNGITVIPIGEKFAKVVNEATAPTSGGIISTNDPTGLADAGKFVTQIVQFKYASPDDVKAILESFSRSQKSFMIIPSTSTVILRDYTENVKRMVEMLTKIDVPTPLQVKPEVIKIKYALAADISEVLTSLGGGGGVSVGKSSSQSNFQPGFANSGMGGMGGMGGYGNSYNNPGLSGSPMNSPATSARSSFQNNLQRVVRSAGAGAGAGDFQLLSETKIIADERTNSLLVFANDQDMATIKDIISKLDIVLAQVLIEAIILEVALADSRDIGISYLQRQKNWGDVSGAGGLNNMSGDAKSFLGGGGSSGGGTNSNPLSGIANLPGGFSYFAKFNNSLDIVLTAVAGDRRANVLSRPRIQTSHAVPADLFIGKTVPYVTGTYYGGYSGGPSSQYQQKEVGIRLQVLPLINPEGLVVMDIQQDIEQVLDYVEITGVGKVPTTRKRQAGAKVAVRDGETIILGGFISADRAKTHSGIPWLMNIPGIGALFRSNFENNERSELIVLLKPTVLPTPEAAASVASSERDKMSGVKQAELDLREDEAKRNASIEEDLRKEKLKKEKKAKADAAKRAKTGQTENVPAWDEAPKATPAPETVAPQSSTSVTPVSAEPTTTTNAPTYYQIRRPKKK